MSERFKFVPKDEIPHETAADPRLMAVYARRHVITEPKQSAPAGSFVFKRTETFLNLTALEGQARVEEADRKLRQLVLQKKELFKR